VVFISLKESLNYLYLKQDAQGKKNGAKGPDNDSGFFVMRCDI
jgi:hypothetical protein